ncbi:hypothetical protein WKI71_43200 [Streptomyces sp. MS1.AVA.1]|uniref:Uncharacterized protein n=1 Tax=Streptomyces machairae TaxID=3134109 RepID=A0ABU8UUV5_9ACTN
MVERDVLVLQRAEGGRAHPVEQFAEVRIAAEIGAQRHGVDHHAEQPLGLGPAAARDARCDTEVVHTRPAVQEYLEGGEHHREQGDPLAPGQRTDLVGEVRRDGEPGGVTHEPACRGTGAVRGQIEEVGDPTELPRPVRELLLGVRSRQPGPLPGREVGELELWFGQRRHPV